LGAALLLQGTHVLARVLPVSLEKLPLAQAVHALRPVPVPKVPAAQEVHTVPCRLSGENVPAGQSWHQTAMLAVYPARIDGCPTNATGVNRMYLAMTLLSVWVTLVFLFVFPVRVP
jgi:hypothetical protein